MEREFKIAGVGGGFGLGAWILGGPLAGILVAIGSVIIAQKQFPEGDKPWGRIQDLLSHGEGRRVEFKANLSFNGKKSAFDGIVKSIAGFANDEGGEILLGISDDSTIVGITAVLKRLGGKDKLLLALHDAVRNGLQPLALKQYRAKYESISNQEILRIEVEKANLDLFTKDGHYYKRQDNRTIRMSTHEYQESKKDIGK
jgi:predicted HTH transcriptional regulator